jgi:exonuclease V
MLYKELFDAMISSEDDSVIESSVSNVTMSFDRVFSHLDLSPTEPFSEAFIKQSRPIVIGNMLRYETGSARCLNDMAEVWRRYVDALGLGVSGKECQGKSEDHLELVYRRAGGRKGKSRDRGNGKGGRKRKAVNIAPSSSVSVDESEDRELQLAIEISLQTGNAGGNVEDTSTSMGPAETMDAADERMQVDSSDLAQMAETNPNTVDTTSPLDTTNPISTIEAVQRPSCTVSPSEDEPVPSEEAAAYLHPPNFPPMTEEEREREEDAIALEVELSYRKTGEIQDAGEVIPIRASQDPKEVMDLDQLPGVEIGMIEEDQDDEEGPKSGGIIGRHRFKYDPRLLRVHLENVMSYWHGVRQPSGVDINNTRRCGWCEFEDGCEWR